MGDRRQVTGNGMCCHLFTAAVLLLAASLQAAPRRVVFTFDDIPGVQHAGDRCNLRPLNQKLVDAIKRNRIPALGLVTESRACNAKDLPALYRIWLDAGLELGNHTASHRDFNNQTLEWFQQDTIAGEKTLRAMGRKPRYFRYPFLRSGLELSKKRAFEKWLRERGYTDAPVTIDNDEYIYAAVYARADAATRQRIATDYLRYMESMFAYFEQFSVDVLGYELPQILLLHDNSLNADHLDALVAMAKRRGYSFISIDEALKDPAYKRQDAYVGRRGLSWLQRWNLDAGGKVRWAPPDPPDWVMKLYDTR